VLRVVVSSVVGNSGHWGYNHAGLCSGSAVSNCHCWAVNVVSSL
jgi:hypothetical protein